MLNTTNFQMNPMILDQNEHLFPGISLRVAGDLEIVQKKPLPSYGEFNFVENVSNETAQNQTDLIGAPTEDIAEWFPLELMMQNLRENYTLGLQGYA